MTSRTVLRILAAPGVAAFAATASAASLDALQGAWTMEGTQCASTFRKVGDVVEFIDRSSSLTTGIIISGNEIRGPNATCTAQRIRDNGDHFTVLLGCADTIMFETVPVSFKMIDADHFDRFETQFPDISFSYQRCKF